MRIFLPKKKYLGLILIRANAIKNMTSPTNVLFQKSFLGLGNYYMNYNPNMHTLKVPFKHTS